MSYARVCLTRIIALSFPLIAATILLTSPTMAAMGGSQYCRPSQSCKIGEFLFDDNYAPITDALCLMSTYTPSDSLLYDEVEMATGSAGWYDYDFTAQATEGYYRTQICCYTDGEKLCLDKSFNVEANAMNTASAVAGAVWDANTADHNIAGSFGEQVQTPSLSTSAIASAVWGYSGRTLSDFGTLVTDIWSNSTRTLTSLGSVVADIWASPDRTLSDFGTLVTDIWTHNDRQLTSLENQTSQIWNYEDRSLTSSVHVEDQSVSTITNSVVETLNNNNSALNTGISDDLEWLKGMVLENRNLLEQLVNKPIIETFIEEDDLPDLSSKLDQTREVARGLQMDTNLVAGKLGILEAGWEELGDKEVLAVAEEMLVTLGGEEDGLDHESISGRVNWLAENWGFDVLSQLDDNTSKFRDKLTALEIELKSLGKTRKALDLFTQLKGNGSMMAMLVGSTSDQMEGASLFAKIEEVEKLAVALDEKEKGVTGLLTAWEREPTEKLFEDAKGMAAQVNEVNQLSRIRSVFEVGVRGLLSRKELKNAVLAMQGVIEANRKLLAGKPEQVLSNVWLEEGSIVFKALLTNPSRRISQDVPLKYYLPSEIREEDILDADLGLSVTYDAERDQYAVEGTFSLAPGESKTLSVRTQDIWVISKDQVESLRVQVQELSRPLDKTSYFAQGVTLASDIDVALNKIIVLQEAAVTPEQKIRAYREAKLELSGVVEKIEKLKELVTLAGSAGNLFGFVGGAQALAVWGLIIIMSAGFVFLALYMRVLRQGEGKQKIKKGQVKKIPQAHKIGYKEYKNISSGFPWKLALPVIVVGLSSLTMLAIWAVGRASVSQEETVGVAGAVEEEQIEATASHEPSSEADVETVGATGGVDVVKLVVEPGQEVSVFNIPSTEGKIITKVGATREVIRLGDYKGWINVVLKSPEELGTAETGWVEASAIFGEGEEDKEVKSPQSEVTPAEVKGVETEKHTSVTVAETETGWLRVRKTPKGAEVAKVGTGEVYPVLDQIPEWVMISLDDGSVGWVSEKFVEME